MNDWVVERDEGGTPMRMTLGWTQARSGQRGIGNDFAFARWYRRTYPYASSFYWPTFNRCALDEWRRMQRESNE